MRQVLATLKVKSIKLKNIAKPSLTAFGNVLISINLKELRDMKSKKNYQINSSLKFEDDILTTNEAAIFLKISVGTLRNLTSNGKVPYYKFGRRNRYFKSELLGLILNKPKGGLHGN